MSKLKYKIAIALAAVLVLGSVLYIYLAHYAPYKPDTEQTVGVWYSDDDAMWSGFKALCEEYNGSEGAKYGIKISPRAFESDEELYKAVCDAAESGGELPAITACDSDFAAYLDEKGLAADMDKYFGKWETSGYNSTMKAACTGKNGLVAIPIAAETELFIVNTDLFSDSAAVSNFEKLCSVANEYYKRNSESFFTISSYSMFFRDAIGQLGEKFDGLSPHDTDSENCKYVYKLLAETAYDRGFTSVGTEAAEYLAEGKIAAAVISSADIMKCASSLDGENFVFSDFPYMKDGKAVYIEKVTGMTILAADRQTEKCAQMFLRWFASSEVNSRFVGDSGYIAAIGSQSSSSEHEIYSRLMDAVSKMQKKGERIDYAADAGYSENSRNFDIVLRTIMSSLN